MIKVEQFQVFGFQTRVVEAKCIHEEGDI